jgi:hypothetical protein
MIYEKTGEFMGGHGLPRAFEMSQTFLAGALSKNRAPGLPPQPK